MIAVKRGQAAFEYMLIALVIGVMILPAAYLFFNYSQDSAEQIDKAQLDRLGRDVAGAAESIYYQGPPSRTELEARMPNGVSNLSIIGDWNSQRQQLLISARSKQVDADFPFPSPININGSFLGALYNVSISPGIKKITLEAYETAPGANGEVTPFVHINFGGRCPRSTTTDYNGDGAVTGLDSTFFNRCFCNTANYPKYRPTETWTRGWFDNSGAFAPNNPFAVCINSDYDGDCEVDQSDADLACSSWNAFCSVFTCPAP